MRKIIAIALCALLASPAVAKSVGEKSRYQLGIRDQPNDP